MSFSFLFSSHDTTSMVANTSTFPFQLPEQQSHRWLFVATRHNIFYLLYLCVLAICCIAPCSYYIRLYIWQRQRLRRLEELERAGLVAALQRTLAATTTNTDSHDHPLQAAIREERRARILQLLEPVQQKLQADDFREIDPSDGATHAPAAAPTTPEATPDDDTTTTGPKPPRLLFTNTPATIEKSKYLDDDDTASVNEDDERLQIRVPDDSCSKASSSAGGQQYRWVPGQCTICLCRYRPGVIVARASTPSCPHVFHSACIETWLLRQQDDPVCPCCRQDFLVDPYDVAESGMGDDEAAKDSSQNRRDDREVEGEDRDEVPAAGAMEEGAAVVSPGDVLEDDSLSSPLPGTTTASARGPSDPLTLHTSI